MNTEELMKLADAYAAAEQHDYLTGEASADHARAALEAALSAKQGEQEPVAWLYENEKDYRSPFVSLTNRYFGPDASDWKLTPLYTHPAPEAKQEAVGTEWTACVKLPVTVHVRQQRPGETHVSTREGITPVKPDDLIMRGVSGEEYPIGREIFERTYQIGEAHPAPSVNAQEESNQCGNGAGCCYRAALLDCKDERISELEAQNERLWVALKAYHSNSAKQDWPDDIWIAAEVALREAAIAAVQSNASTHELNSANSLE